MTYTLRRYIMVLQKVLFEQPDNSPEYQEIKEEAMKALTTIEENPALLDYQPILSLKVVLLKIV